MNKELTSLQKSIVKIMISTNKDWSAVELSQRGIETTLGGIGSSIKALVKFGITEQTRRAIGKKSAKYRLTQKGIKIAKEL